MKDLINVPNTLTLARLVLIPVLIVIFYLSVYFSWARPVAAIIFAMASITDWLDGFCARKFGQVSKFGAFLDPVADKVLIVTSLMLLVSLKEISYITIPAIIIVCREIIISSLREWMAEIGKRTSIAVNYMGKIKTFVQMISLILLLAANPADSWWGVLGFILLYVAAILTIWSMVIYLGIAWPSFKQDSNKN